MITNFYDKHSIKCDFLVHETMPSPSTLTVSPTILLMNVLLPTCVPPVTHIRGQSSELSNENESLIMYFSFGFCGVYGVVVFGCSGSFSGLSASSIFFIASKTFLFNAFHFINSVLNFLSENSNSSLSLVPTESPL